jgi:hypothetical protein
MKNLSTSPATTPGSTPLFIEILAMICLAFGIGLAIATALGGTVLLLAGA